MKSIDSDENSKATTIILTICNSHGKKFQTQYVPFAIAMQQVFVKKSKKASGKTLLKCIISFSIMVFIYVSISDLFLNLLKFRQCKMC